MAVNRRSKPVPEPQNTEPIEPQPVRHLELLVMENVKRLKAVELKLKGRKLVRLSGPNAAGKSSILDGLDWLFTGIKNMPNDPIRRGQERAKMEAHFQDFVVTRKLIRGGKRGGVLEVFDKTSKSKRLYPQAFLDQVLGRFAFDPLQFMRMDQGEQLETLRKLLPESAEIDRMDNDTKADYKRRTALGHQIKPLEIKIAQMEVVADLPAEPVDEAALTQRLAQAGVANLERERSLAQQGRLEDALSTARTLKQDDEGQLAKLRKQLASLEASIVTQTKSIADYEKQLKAHTVPAPVSTADIQREVEYARNLNRAIAVRDQRAKLEAERDALKGEHDELSEAIRLRDARKVYIFANAKMPLDGLSYSDDDGVMFNGVAFDQLSDGEQITVSASIAMSGNSTLRVMRIKDGSLLDQKSQALLVQLADQHNYQVIMEVVDTTGEIGFVIEDGEVKRDAN